MMQKLARSDLMTLERYAEARPAFRAEVLAHKAPRRIALGPNATLIFEDRLTIQYQIQEMLRVERIFEAAGIDEELASYNPLIPDGGNWKATLLIEFPDVAERRQALARLRRVEHAVWVRVGDCERRFAVANEDLDRTNEEKTSAVHFLRFELSPAEIDAAKDGAAISFGVDHEHMDLAVTVDEASRASLVGDLT